MRMIRGLLLLGMLSMLALTPAAQAHKQPTVDDLFAQMKNVNPDLKDYQADININLKVKAALLTIPLNLQGKYLYKRPDHYKLKLERAPKIVQKYPQIFGWNLPDLKDFESKILDDEPVDGHLCYHIHLSPRHEMADMLGQDMWVSKDDFTLPRQITHYKDNGQIEVNVKYLAKDNKYRLFDRMNATFSFPKVNVTAQAEASYANYMVNSNLPDSVFSEPK